MSDHGETGRLEVLAGDGGCTVVLHGEIDLALTRRFGAALAIITSHGGWVEVDLADVTFMDGAGVAFLSRLAATTGVRVRVLHAPPFVREVLRITAVDRELDLSG